MSDRTLANIRPTGNLRIFENVKADLKIFKAPAFYDFQGPQANLTIFKAITGLEFICQNSRLFNAFKAPRKPYFLTIIRGKTFLILNTFYSGLHMPI